MQKPKQWIAIQQGVLDEMATRETKRLPRAVQIELFDAAYQIARTAK